MSTAPASTETLRPSALPRGARRDVEAATDLLGRARERVGEAAAAPGAG